MRISPGPVLVREIDRRVSHAKVYGSSRLVRCVNGVFVLGDVGFFVGLRLDRLNVGVIVLERFLYEFI